MSGAKDFHMNQHVGGARKAAGCGVYMSLPQSMETEPFEKMPVRVASTIRAGAEDSGQEVQEA
jgi:hypothetical protein